MQRLMRCICLGLVCVIIGGCAQLHISSTPVGAEVYDSKQQVLLGRTPYIMPTLKTGEMALDVRKQGYESKPLIITPTSPQYMTVDLGDKISGMVLMEVVIGAKGLEVRESGVYSEKDVIERSPSVRAVRQLTNLSNTRWVGSFRLFPTGDKILMEILDQETTTDGQKVLFSNLWSTDVGQSGGLQRWTDGKYFDAGPCFSSDGKFLYFSSNRAGKNSIFRLSVTNLKGLGLVTAGATADSLPAQSPDGTSLIWTAAMEGSDIPQIWSLPLSGGLPSGLPMQLREGSGARWSPDGKHLMFTAMDRNIGKIKIWLMEPDGSNPIQLTTGSDCNDIDPFWSPDGSKIIFASDRGVAGGKANYDIWLMDATGANVKQLTTNGSRDDHPIISEDGKTVYFRSNRGFKWDIWVMEIADAGNAE